MSAMGWFTDDETKNKLHMKNYEMTLIKATNGQFTFNGDPSEFPLHTVRNAQISGYPNMHVGDPITINGQICALRLMKEGEELKKQESSDELGSKEIDPVHSDLRRSNELLAQAGEEITQLRNRANVMSARLSMFDNVMQIFNVRPQEMGCMDGSQDIVYKIKSHIGK